MKIVVTHKNVRVEMEDETSSFEYGTEAVKTILNHIGELINATTKNKIHETTK